MLKVSNQKLLLVAGAVWLVAGFNVINIGLNAYFSETGWLFWVSMLGTLAVFVLFHIMVFSKMVGKHSDRILSLEEERSHIAKFFDKKGYIMMGCMMGLGIGFRVTGLVPDWFVAFFYTGLGAALAVAGLSFLLRFYKGQKAGCPVMPSTYTSKNKNTKQ